MQANEDSPKGFVLATTAYLMWGVLPLYMKALAHIPPAEVVAHRILWSVPIAGLVLLWTRRLADLRHALRTPRMLGMAVITAALISVNWGIYVWAIAAGQALDAALGYYINPLFSIFLGAVLLGERLSRLQLLAVALAGAAVLILTLASGRIPVVALGLTFSWGAYAFCKKSLPIGPNQGFLLEVLILTPPAIAYLGWTVLSGDALFGDGAAGDVGLLLGCGAVTAVPLMIYANGAKLLRLSTIGILQYIAPTMIFLTAVLVFGEAFDPARRVAFPMIWLALVIYTGSMLRRPKRPATG
ncbi:EamA family transporter RarD [Limimaricola hongkongensis]|uniref:RarD n=1 Tax=Limimaricola hongkongensis DSM 17492 TaxID=1122180 RepID=A0A017H893_9RHOB|nr:EamA family transporter RarD [Limimaricola hongkongensis]EYD70571.1 RarD [Limimaricola hongkongensis DSM 17492]